MAPDLRALTSAELNGMSALDLVRAAIAWQPNVKVASDALVFRSPDSAAAEYLVAAFARGEVPPWMTAHLLGQLRAAGGYDTVRGILLAAPGQLAESYAGTALARIRGMEALPDLVEVLNNAPVARSREGAAFGLGVVGTPAAADAIFDAAAAGHLRVRTAAYVLGGMPVDQARVADALLSGNERLVRLGTETVWSIASTADRRPGGAPTFVRPDSCLDNAQRKVIADAQRDMTPSQRRAIDDWVAVIGKTTCRS